MLFPGMKAIIIWYDSDDYPDSWSSEMLEWRDEVITIRHVSKNGDVLIEEDEGEWVWNEEDFEPVALPSENPNSEYKNKKARERREKFLKEAGSYATNYSK